MYERRSGKGEQTKRGKGCLKRQVVEGGLKVLAKNQGEQFGML